MENGIINKLTLNPKRIFLIDSFGAFLTAFFLVAILSTFEKYFGMPRQILVFLSIVALVYAIYSICCFYFIESNWRPFLKTICITNLIYCGLTIGLVINFYPRLTILGTTYFLLEIILISVLVIIERKALSITPYVIWKTK
jgi:hypothetical protein